MVRDHEIAGKAAYCQPLRW